MAASRTEWDVPRDQVVRASAGQGWRGLDAAEVLHPQDDFAVAPLERHILVFNLGTPMAATERGSGLTGHLDARGTMVLPAGRDRRWHLDREGEVRHLHVYMDRGFLEQTALAADVDPDQFELFEGYGVQDAFLERIGDALLAELGEAGVGGQIFVESLGAALAVHLLRHYSTARLRRPREGHALSPAMLATVTAYVEEHLAGDLDLPSVAASVHLSPYYFARLFKERTGSTVHRFVMERRVRRAEELVHRTDLTLSAVAHSVGFANRAHMAVHFRRLLGLSPSQARRARS